MLSLDKAGIDKLLLQLEDRGFINLRYKFYKVNNELSLLGKGGFSFVYEMYDSLNPENHYAAKIIGIGAKDIDERLIRETTRLQHFLSEQSVNIVPILGLWTMKLHLDELGNVTNVIWANAAGYEEDDGLHFEILLMKKLEPVIEKDKYGNIEITRDELKTEEGVITFAKDICGALYTVHKNSCLHRDIKLENIFWDESAGKYKLGDFGIARFTDGGEAETVVFTNGYGAPEIECQLEEAYNLTADIYSFGITLYLLLNDLKFPASDGYHANIVQYSRDFVLPAPVHASEKMAGIIRKMCSYRMRDRYQSIEELLTAINEKNAEPADLNLMEYEDLDTESYRNGGNLQDDTLDEDDGVTETFKESDGKNTDAQEHKAEGTWREKDESKLTREERKKKLLSDNEDYSSYIKWNMVFIAAATALLFRAISPDRTYAGSWGFLLVPLALFVAAILQRVKEFHVVWTIFTVGASCISMYFCGIDAPQITAIAVVLLGIPSATAGTAIGMGLWIAQMLTGKPEWLEFLCSLDLGWILLIALLYLLEKCIIMRIVYDKATAYEGAVYDWLMDYAWLFMIIAGLVLLILQHFKVITIPALVSNVHLIRTGAGLMAIKMLFFIYYDILGNEEKITDESLDE